jgi:hypothetical protein
MKADRDRRKTQQWEFLQDRSRGGWYWRCLKRGSQSDCSSRVFTSRTDCIADAMEHGYLETTPWVEQQAS